MDKLTFEQDPFQPHNSTMLPPKLLPAPTSLPATLPSLCLAVPRVPILLSLKFCSFFKAHLTLGLHLPQAKIVSPLSSRELSSVSSGLWVLSSDLTADAHPRAGPMTLRKKEPAFKWWLGQPRRPRTCLQVVPWAFRQTLWTSLEQGLSPAGWLVLWEAEGQPVPKQRPSILSRGLVVGPSTESAAMYPECQHAWPSPASCLAEGSFPEVSSAVGESSYFMGPHRWGGGCQTQQHWTCTGDQAGSTGRGDLLQKGQRWVSSFARRSHLCESHHYLLRADLS